ncbi:hypothetical protein PV325_009449 [Microctonus aethiopoides]|nr:hypothetical protein PV325_009449 [Microctonus aethiopoides]
MAAHIRAKYKDDQAGIGYSNIHDDKLWTEQQDSFHDLLQQLQETKDLAKIECPVDKAKITSGSSKNKQVVNSSFQNDDDESYKHKAEFIGVLKGTHKIGLEKK